MTAPVNGGDLVENLIYMAFKDKYIRSAEAFKQLIKKNYGYTATSDLYARIVNYQVKRYGISLSNLSQREYDKYFGQKETLQRKKRSRWQSAKQLESRKVERIEKNKCKKSIKRKNT